MGDMTGTVDGRTLRRERNRQEVVDAALALVDEGVVDPSVEQLTARSGLSARSVFRYFDGLDDLRREVIRHHFDRLQKMVDPADAADGPLETRIKRFVDSRVRFNQSVEGTARTALMRAPFSPVIAEDVRGYRQVLDSSVRHHFGPELDAMAKAEAEDLVSVIDVLVSFPSWDQMTTGQGRTKAQVKRAWTVALESLLR